MDQCSPSSNSTFNVQPLLCYLSQVFPAHPLRDPRQVSPALGQDFPGLMYQFIALSPVPAIAQLKFSPLPLSWNLMQQELVALSAASLQELLEFPADS